MSLFYFDKKWRLTISINFIITSMTRGSLLYLMTVDAPVVLDLLKWNRPKGVSSFSRVFLSCLSVKIAETRFLWRYLLTTWLCSSANVVYTITEIRQVNLHKFVHILVYNLFTGSSWKRRCKRIFTGAPSNEEKQKWWICLATSQFSVVTGGGAHLFNCRGRDRRRQAREPGSGGKKKSFFEQKI